MWTPEQQLPAVVRAGLVAVPGAGGLVGHVETVSGEAGVEEEALLPPLPSDLLPCLGRPPPRARGGGETGRRRWPI
jgi:hypothetical protein